MNLKEGTLGSLIQNLNGFPPTAVRDALFPQMLGALDCLAYNGIVHRDVKPENILYTSPSSGQYHFHLGDFGSCNRVVDATTFTGSRLYMAPEMFRDGGQTPKLDVWSLYVTLLWTLDIESFRQRARQFQSVDDIQGAVLHAATSDNVVSGIQEMAVVNPMMRASAGQMLLKHYDGVGLYKPGNQRQ